MRRRTFHHIALIGAAALLVACGTETEIGDGSDRSTDVSAATSASAPSATEPDEPDPTGGVAHTPEELLPAALDEADVAGSDGRQGLVASSYDSRFDFVPCSGTDEFTYMRAPQVDAVVDTVDGEWQQMITSSIDVEAWYDEVAAAYDRCLTDDPDRRVEDAAILGDESATYALTGGAADSTLVNVTRTGTVLVITLYWEGAPIDDLTVPLDGFLAVVGATVDRLIALPEPVPPSSDGPSAQRQVAEHVFETAAQDGMEIDEQCVVQLASRLSDEDAAIILAAFEYGGTPYYASAEGRRFYSVGLLKCVPSEVLVDALFEQIAASLDTDPDCTHEVLSAMPGDDFRAIVVALLTETDADDVLAELRERLSEC